ncbi:MAG TPA: DUF3108 domain-containing protein [Bryobacteraceae bacterium]|nr:DUF3108 domain-containing protein [Bryobacteraceae bacterium]
MGGRRAVLTFVLAAGMLTAQDLPRPAAASPPGVPPHEKLEYAIEWRLIPAGTASLTWAGLSNAGAGGELRLHLESAGLVSRLFRVEDDYTASLGPNYCVQNYFLSAHEGNRSRDTRVVYDAQTRKASYIEKDLIKNSVINHEVDIPACVHDVVGGLLVLRNLRLEPGKTAQIPISDGKKFVQAKIESQRREEVKTELGTFKTVRYEVFLFDNVLFKRAGHLHVWLTDDDWRLPVQLQVRLQFTIGTITFRLRKQEK